MKTQNTRSGARRDLETTIWRDQTVQGILAAGAILVGGCVRDHLAGKPFKDFDFLMGADQWERYEPDAFWRLAFRSKERMLWALPGKEPEHPYQVNVLSGIEPLHYLRDRFDARANQVWWDAGQGRVRGEPGALESIMKGEYLPYIPGILAGGGPLSALVRALGMAERGWSCPREIWEQVARMAEAVMEAPPNWALNSDMSGEAPRTEEVKPPLDVLGLEVGQVIAGRYHVIDFLHKS
jgi:hypothetical protein